MRTEARFPAVGAGAGHYESFYIKATRPGGGGAVWIRHTVHQRPGEPRTGSVWFTHFDAELAGPQATKLTVGADDVSAPSGAYIRIDGALLEPGHARAELETIPPGSPGTSSSSPRRRRFAISPTGSSTTRRCRGRSSSRRIPTPATTAR